MTDILFGLISRYTIAKRYTALFNFLPYELPGIFISQPQS